MTQTNLSIVVLNWNGAALLKQCLPSIMDSCTTGTEVIVVDNASTDDSLEVARAFPGVRVVANDTNLGYAAGNNVGFKAATGKYVVTLNNDITVEPDWLQQAVETLEADESIGIVSCRQMSYYDHSRIDTLYSYPTSHLLLGRYGHRQVYDPANPLHATPGYVIGANGASAIYRKELIDRLGGFEESFFAYQEECDLHMRAFYAGWKCLYLPQSVVYHMGSVSFDKVPRTFYYYHERNRMWFIYRNFPWSILLRYLPTILFREFRTATNMTVRRRIIGTYMRARLDGLRAARRFAAVRRANMAAYRARHEDLAYFFKQRKRPLPNGF
jgi:hypothetical protein